MYMYCLLKDKGRLSCVVAAIILCGACQRKPAEERFLAPVQEVIRLDSTVIGISTVAAGLKVPWEIAWGPDGWIWFTEQSGTISKVDPHTGKKKVLVQVPGVFQNRTLGLLGMAISTEKGKPYVFADYTYREQDSVIRSRLVRYTYTKAMDTLINPKVIFQVPGSPYGHNGSRVALSPGGKVFWTTGDFGANASHQNAQDTSSLNGKVLRLNMDGSIPEDNPFPGSPVWSLGHRNAQGLVFTTDGVLFESEHGPATDDEVNRIVKGGNYGWPEVRGYCNLPEEQAYCDSVAVVEPLRAWTPTIAPSGMEYYRSGKIPEWRNAILLSTLKDESFRVLKLNEQQDSVLSEEIYFQGKFGRLRDICVSPDGDIYLSTSNRDWNPLGKPGPQDDRIIRIAKVSQVDNLSGVNVRNPRPASSVRRSPGGNSAKDAAALYQSYCSSCHKPDGKGIPGTFPALDANPLVNGDKARLISIALRGAAAIPAENKTGSGESMPAFNFLTDQQIAGILTYIRAAWSNRTDSVSTKEVSALRKTLK